MRETARWQAYMERVKRSSSLPEIRDPNRGGQLRLDYVFENLDGVRCQLHPGNKSKDAIPIFNEV